MNKSMVLAFSLTVALVGGANTLRAADPDYSDWNALLQRYYSPSRGMNYAGLKKNDLATLNRVRANFARVNVASLSKKEQLAFWINLYNASTVGVVVDKYPIKSIRDLSTDPLVRLNVFKKKVVPLGNRKLSLNDIENDFIRTGFKDPRIHFAINCAAKSCPPMPEQALTGARVDAQLDEQVKKFVAGNNLRVERKGDKAVMHTTMITKWFKEDFDNWGGGVVKFFMKYLPQQKVAQLSGARVTIEHDDYDWALNDSR